MDDTEATIAEIAETKTRLSKLCDELAGIEMSDGMWAGWYDLAARKEDIQKQIDALEERLDMLTRERDRQTRTKACQTDAGDTTQAGTMGNGKHDSTHSNKHDVVCDSTHDSKHGGTHDVMGAVRRIAQSLEHDDSVTVRTRDGRTIAVTAILYDGSGWYATSGTGTYDRHGLRQYGTGEVVRMDDVI